MNPTNLLSAWNDHPLIYRGHRVVTLSMIAEVHGVPYDRVWDNFRNQRERGRQRLAGKRGPLPEKFEGFSVSQRDWRKAVAGFEPENFRFKEEGRGGARADVPLLIERGYVRLCKSLTDDIAWDVHDQVCDGYFAAKDRDAELRRLLIDIQTELQANRDEVSKVRAERDAYRDELRHVKAKRVFGNAAAAAFIRRRTSEAARDLGAMRKDRDLRKFLDDHRDAELFLEGHNDLFETHNKLGRTLGERVKKARQVRGFTAKALADAAGCSASTLRRIERDKVKPRKKTLVAIAKALNTKLERLTKDVMRIVEVA